MFVKFALCFKQVFIARVDSRQLNVRLLDRLIIAVYQFPFCGYASMPVTAHFRDLNPGAADYGAHTIQKKLLGPFLICCGKHVAGLTNKMDFEEALTLLTKNLKEEHYAGCYPQGKGSKGGKGNAAFPRVAPVPKPAPKAMLPKAWPTPCLTDDPDSSETKKVTCSLSSRGNEIKSQLAKASYESRLETQRQAHELGLELIEVHGKLLPAPPPPPDRDSDMESVPVEPLTDPYLEPMEQAVEPMEESAATTECEHQPDMTVSTRRFGDGDAQAADSHVNSEGSGGTD